MNKFKFYIDLDKEEKWLNKMAKAGWELKDKFCCYTFQKAAPSDTIIKIDYRNFKTSRDFVDYLALFKDSGWEHIAGSKSSGAQYFKKISNDGDEDIFSDIPSKAARYRRISNMWLTMAISYIPLFISLTATKSIDTSTFLNPKLLYYTPGLWEKNGISFLCSFLFETPFAMMRGISWLFFPVMIILYFIFTIKAEIKYRKASY
ncbi:MAG: DUF2812 domain-containing protein [Bacillota bacterium]|nr:DUF2812 domain-containing protein [Bacillota bacterium]